ncbi:MAG: redoxin domain-containing protein [Candidatus Omnitrophica bacterium]|nr:redoxin domain-containing protein [Candidatus Omnitrophota bacterium]
MSGKHVRYFFAVVGAVLCAAACGNDLYALSERMRGEEEYSREGSVAAPEFALKNSDGEIYTLSQYRDRKSVILFFWTSWCVNCREGIRVLDEMYPRISKENFEVFAINVGEDKGKVARFVQARKLRFKVLLDPGTETAADFRLVGVPTYVIIDKKGYVRFYGHFFPRDDFRRLAGE